MNIDITKKYTTRSGLPVRIYTVDGGGAYSIHGAYLEQGMWLIAQWSADGRLFPDHPEGPRDLIPVKTWRAWTLEEAPKFFMARRKTRPDEREVIQVSENTCQKVWFDHYTRIHEDGSETPCGIES